MDRPATDSNRPSFPARFGAELSTWPRTKLEHARRRARDIESVDQLWRSSAPMVVEMVADKDLSTLHGTARITSQPPLDEISLLFGDLLHALRSSMDNFAWELAHIDGRTPSNERQLYFPICKTEQAWERKLPTLNTWPEEAVQIVHELQPFAENEMQRSPLYWLEELNNREKHRQRLEVRPGDMLSNARFNIALRADTTMAFSTRANLPSDFHGLEIMRVRIEPPALEFFPEPIEIGPELIVRLDSAVAPLPVVIAALIGDVARTLAVLTGELERDAPRPLFGEGPQLPADEPDEDGFVPVHEVNVTRLGPL